MAIALTKRSVKGSKLTHAEVDNNWTLIEQAINTSAVTAKTKTVTLVVGNNVVDHGIGRKARFVTFFTNSGQPTYYRWYRHSEDELNKIVVEVPEDTPSAELSNTEINIQTI